MIYRKGELGLYDCRERSAGRKLFMAFIAGRVCGVMLIVGLSFLLCPATDIRLFFKTPVPAGGHSVVLMAGACGRG